VPTISLAGCPDYDHARVLEALELCLELLGGIGRFVRPGDRVLLKVNLLLGVPPERAVTTHPSVVRAMAELVKRAGGEPWIGDASGVYGLTGKALRVAGFAAAAEATGARLVNFEQAGSRKIDLPASRILEAVYVARPVLECDVLISLPKLKTHQYTRMTGAIKNSFGFIPGGVKSQVHMIARTEERFCEALVDIFEIRKPDLCVIDAVEGMEGQGPTAGRPIRSALLLAGTDPVALDAVASSAMGIDDPAVIGTTRIAHERGHGEIDLDRIEIAGPPLSEVRRPFRTAGIARAFVYSLPGPLHRMAFRQLRAYTSIQVDEERCVRCASCEKGCPADAIRMDPYPVVDEAGCIKCYCCHELCAEKALYLKQSLGGRILARILMPEMTVEREKT